MYERSLAEQIRMCACGLSTWLFAKGNEPTTDVSRAHRSRVSVMRASLLDEWMHASRRCAKQ